MSTLSTAEKEALAEFYEGACKNNKRTRWWIWIRFSAVVLLLSVRSLVAIFFPEQFATLFSNSAVYFETVTYRLYLFLLLTVVYAIAFWLRVYLREASLAAAIILATLLWADIELHLAQHATLTEIWSGHIALRVACVILAIMNFFAAGRMTRTS